MSNGISLSQDLIFVLMIIWIIFACLCLTRYFFAVQDDKIYIKTLRKQLFGNLAISVFALGLAIALVKLFMELAG